TRWPRDWSSDVCSSDLDNKRRAGLCASDEFCHVSMQFRAVYLQKHLFRLALADERKLEGVRRGALLLMFIDCRYAPVVIAGIESAEVCARPGDHLLGGDAGKPGIRAHAQAVGGRLGNGRPGKMHASMLRVCFDQRLKV